MKTDIQNRKDVKLLVSTFYSKIRQDSLLGTIFNSMIAEGEWETHLEKLTDFWETNLFGIPKFKGAPTQKHIKTDSHFNHIIDKKYFDQWLNLWTSSIDALFEGDLATRAKAAAHSIAEIQHVILQRNKPLN